MESRLSSSIAGFLAVLCISAVAGGQDVSSSDLENCAKIATPELRLECFEALVESGSGIQDKDVASASGNATETAVQEPGPTTRTPATSEPTPAEAPVVSTPAVEPANAADEVVPDQPAISDPSNSDFGAEQLQRAGTAESNNADISIRVTVTEVSEGPYKVLYFTLANGQRWRQIEGRRFRYPRDREFEATINKGMMGDYRLRLDEDSPMTRIRRIE